MASPLNTKHSEIGAYHYLLFNTGDKFHDNDLYFVSVSGIASKDNLRAIGNSEKKYKKYELTINTEIPTNRIPAPAAPTESGNYQKVFYAKHWTLHAGLNNIYNKGQSNSSGHAVDTFGLILPAGSEFNLVGNTAQIKCKLAVRDTDAYLYQVGFKLDLLLCFAGYAEIK